MTRSMFCYKEVGDKLVETWLLIVPELANNCQQAN